MDVRMTDRTAVITGASMGLGRAMGNKFAKAGADIALVARRPDKLEEARAEVEAGSGRTVRAYSCDVGDPKALADTYKQIESDFGKVDILVNNAGTSLAKPFLEITDEEWLGDFNLKLFAAVRLCRMAIPGMKERGWGRIVNVLNIGAKNPGANGAPTAVTRAAGMAMTKVLSKECAPYNVLVNALCTGQFVTEQWHTRHQRVAPDRDFDDFLQDTIKAIPVGRMGQTEEFANIACLLASDAGGFITGVAINVDGGRSPSV